MGYSYPRFTPSELGLGEDEEIGYRNFMFLVGNGFDIRILKALKIQEDTSYQSFYKFLLDSHFDTNNCILKQMTAKKGTAENWCDFEIIVGELIRKGTVKQLNRDLDNIQDAFVTFLQRIVTSELLIKLDNYSKEKLNSPNQKDTKEIARAQLSLSKFFGDLDCSNREKLLNCLDKFNHRQVINYLFVNFNYTPLLDSFIYLDRTQFNPRPHLTVDRNFDFDSNPKLFDEIDDRWSDYVFEQVIHPHGIFTTPRSLLFGINDPSQAADKSLREIDCRQFMKPFWAQDEVKYNTYFSETELFVTFGVSFGETDKWWWEKILSKLKDEKAALIVYSYDLTVESGSERVEEKVFNQLTTLDGVEITPEIKRRIAVIPFNDSISLNLFSIN